MNDISKQFPILSRRINRKGLVYFDNAATTQKPEAVIESIVKYYSKHNANIHRGLHTLAVDATQKWQKAHEILARFINADSFEEIVFTRNSTEGINFVANTYVRQQMSEGDVIVITEMEHHSNIVPWQIVAREKGLKLEWIPLLSDFSLDLEYLTFLLRKYKERIKLVSLLQLSNVLGVKNDVALVCKMVKEVGAAVLVDAAQSVAHLPIDVQEIGCDFLVFSGHKMYGPTGTGVLYIKHQMAEKLEPWLGGGEMIRKVWKTGAEWNDLPWKFEAGTPDIAGGYALGETVRWFNANIDYKRYAEHEGNLMKMLFAGLKSIPQVTIFGPDAPEQHVGVVTFTLSGLHPHDLATLLDEQGIAIRAGFHCAEPLHKKFDIGPTARVSLAVYNTPDEVRFFIDALKTAVKKFS